MSGPGLPTMQVLLDNFLGAFPYDITQYVRLVDGFTWSRGTPDEESSVSPGNLSITLDNTDGRFTYGTGTYSIATDQQIKVIVNGTTRFFGKVQSWPVSWPTGGQEFSVVQVTAVDDLALSQRRVLQPAVIEDILANSPTALYALSEDSGATMAADTSGNSYPSLSVTGTGTAMTFGSGTGPTDGLSCATFLGGTFLRGTGATWIPTASAFTLECFFTTTLAPANPAIMVLLDTGALINPDVAYMALTAAGKLQVTAHGVSLTSAASVNDGLLHHGAITVTAGGVMNIYLDGAGVGVTATTLFTTAPNRFSIAPSDIPTITTPYVGTIAHAACYSTDLAGVTMTAHSAARDDYTGETPGARLSRVAGYQGLTTGTLDSTGTTLMGIANQGGKTALDVYSEVALATQGAAYVNGSGALTSRTGSSFTSDLTPNAIIDANYFTVDTVTEADNAYMVNYATGKATNSENVWLAKNAFSLGVHGMYREDYEWNVSTDAQAVDRTNWKVGTYGGPSTRLPTLTLDMMSLSGATLTSALTLDVGKFLRITGLPSQTPVGATADLIVLGISETVTTTTWTLTLNCVRHNLYAAWILEDAIWGVLDATTKLYF